MISFKNDYSEGALNCVMEALLKTNLEQTVGYGTDEYTEMAEEAIKKAINFKECYVRLLVGGTQTNLLMISHALRPFEAVIAADTGHISTHEAGAIEATGHKVIELLTSGDGKINVTQIKECYEKHKMDMHMVQPKMVYISNPTELGTLYTKKELEEISNYCKKVGMYLYLDGARMASALASEKNDILLEDYPKYCDAFYIGGTKCGLLFGEALVIVNNQLSESFFPSVKQKGATLAKGRLLGIQFIELMKDNRYYEVGKHSNEMARMLKEGIKEAGFELKADSYTNQQFFILPLNIIEKLEKKYKFEFWEKYDENKNVVRFVTSWATKQENVEEFLRDLKSL